MIGRRTTGICVLYYASCIAEDAIDKDIFSTQVLPNLLQGAIEHHHDDVEPYAWTESLTLLMSKGCTLIHGYHDRIKGTSEGQVEV